VLKPKDINPVISYHELAKFVKDWDEICATCGKRRGEHYSYSIKEGIVTFCDMIDIFSEAAINRAGRFSSQTNSNKEPNNAFRRRYLK